MPYIHLKVSSHRSFPSFTSTFAYQERLGTTPREQALAEYNSYRARAGHGSEQWPLEELPEVSSVEFNDTP